MRDTFDIWYYPKDGEIHVSGTGATFHTTFSNKPGSRRYHPSAFAQFNKVLRDAGEPHAAPDVTSEEDHK